MQILQSDWLGHCTLSPISVQWLEVVNKIKMFPCFSELLKAHLQRIIKFLRRLKGAYWPSSFFATSNHLDRTSLVNKGFIIWDKTPKHNKFSLRNKARIPSGQDSSAPSCPLG